MGFAVGRTTADGLDDALATASRHGLDAVTAFQDVAAAYASADDPDERTAATSDSIDDAVHDFDRAMDDAPWFHEADRAPVDDAIHGLRDANDAGVSPAEFRRSADDVVDEIQDLFQIQVGTPN